MLTKKGSVAGRSLFFLKMRIVAFVALVLGSVLGGREVGAKDFPLKRFAEPPHDYWSREPKDAFARRSGVVEKALSDFFASPGAVSLADLLGSMGLPASSQLLVYSATSLQSGLIRPDNPRALYFSDEVYLGYVPGGRLEVAAIDPEMGPVFYLVEPGRGRVSVSRTNRCMNCHGGRASEMVPGLVAESVIPTTTGASLDGFRREITGHTIPVRDRLGGWYGTGPHAGGTHHGNLLGTAAGGGYTTSRLVPGKSFDWSHYPTGTSDFFVHLVHEHQLGFHNLVTLALYHAREDRPDKADVLERLARRLLDYVLFREEAALPQSGIFPDPVFLRDFVRNAVRAKDGRSLRDVDLQTRMFRYRCSYMGYTQGFKALPESFLRIFNRMLERALSNPSERGFDHIPAAEKKAILEILRDTGVLSVTP